jgi:hypothetical protein
MHCTPGSCRGCLIEANAFARVPFLPRSRIAPTLLVTAMASLAWFERPCHLSHLSSLSHKNPLASPPLESVSSTSCQARSQASEALVNGRKPGGTGPAKGKGDGEVSGTRTGSTLAFLKATHSPARTCVPVDSLPRLLTEHCFVAQKCSILWHAHYS